MSEYDLGINRIIITPNIEKNLRDDSVKDYIVSVITYSGTEKYVVTENDLCDFIKKGVKENGATAL